MSDGHRTYAQPVRASILDARPGVQRLDDGNRYGAGSRRRSKRASSGSMTALRSTLALPDQRWCSRMSEWRMYDDTSNGSMMGATMWSPRSPS